MRTAAVGLHEMFSSLRAAGFTRCEALFLVACSFLGSPPYPPDPDPSDP